MWVIVSNNNVTSSRLIVHIKNVDIIIGRDKSDWQNFSKSESDISFIITTMIFNWSDTLIALEIMCPQKNDVAPIKNKKCPRIVGKVNTTYFQWILLFHL